MHSITAGRGCLAEHSGPGAVPHAQQEGRLSGYCIVDLFADVGVREGSFWGPHVPLARGGQVPGGVVTAGHGTRHSRTVGICLALWELAGNMLSSLPTPGSLPSPFRSQSGVALSQGWFSGTWCFQGSLLAGSLLPTRLPYPRNHVDVGTKQLSLPSLSRFSGEWALITPGPSLLLKNPNYDFDIPVAIVIGYEKSSRGPFGVDFGVKDVV